MQVWTQRVADNTNKEMAEQRMEVNEKLGKMMREIKTIEEGNQLQTENVKNRNTKTHSQRRR